MTQFTPSQHLAWDKLNEIVIGINNITDAELKPLRIIVGEYIAYDREYNGYTADQINAMGRYNLVILRAIESIHAARETFLKEFTEMQPATF